ncbi:uncharacterized protein TNCV_2507081 [Trichonephila clavipes]|nr:uncharacterized protein TNCV_2507081 [Trichonephila clavipes]
MHGGTASTSEQVRSNYWILKGRQLVKRVIKNCFNYRRYIAKPIDQLTSPLPSDRINQRPAFSVCGLDFAGSLYFSYFGELQKYYIVLLTCGITRALHLELVSDMTTNSFLLSFRSAKARCDNIGIGAYKFCICLETFHSIFAVTSPLVPSNSCDVHLTVPNDPRYTRLETNLRIGQAKEGIEVITTGSLHENRIVIIAEIESGFASLKIIWFHSIAVQFPRARHPYKRRRRWVGVKGSTRDGCRDPKCPSARSLRMVRVNKGPPSKGATYAWIVSDEVVHCMRAFLTIWRSSGRLVFV